jgi:hypothetical protein
MNVGLKKERRNEYDPQNPLSKLKTPFMCMRACVFIKDILDKYLLVTLGTLLD